MKKTVCFVKQIPRKNRKLQFGQERNLQLSSDPVSVHALAASLLLLLLTHTAAGVQPLTSSSSTQEIFAPTEKVWMWVSTCWQSPGQSKGRRRAICKSIQNQHKEKPSFPEETHHSSGVLLKKHDTASPLLKAFLSLSDRINSSQPAVWALKSYGKIVLS